MAPMQFLAHLDPKSAIHHSWRERSQVSGLLDGVLFTWDIDLRFYVSGVLPDDRIEVFRLRADKAVVLEAAGVLPGMQQAPENADTQQPENADTQQGGALSTQQQVTTADQQQDDEPTPPNRRKRLKL